MVTLPAAAKKVVSAAESMGFTVISDEFTFHKPEVLWASTTSEHTIGSVRSPAEDIPGVRVVGYRKEARLGFEVFYAGGFKHAHVLDPVGRYRELRVDYEYGAKEIKDYGYTELAATEAGIRRDAEYNDGADIMQREWNFHAANEFYKWVDEWLLTLKSDHPPIAPKPRAPKPTTQEKVEAQTQEMLNGGEWVA